MIDKGNGKFYYKGKFKKKVLGSLAEWKIPENMSFYSGNSPTDIRNLIDMQGMAIKQGETAIRRLPLRRKILKKLIEIKQKQNI